MTSKGEFAAGRGLYYSLFSRFFVFSLSGDTVRKILASTDLRRDEAKFKENEDNVGFVFALMSEFIARANELELYGELEERLFKEIINPNIDEFIESLFNHESSEIYKDVAVLLQGFIEFERVVLSAPRPINQGENKKTLDGVSRSEAIRRQKNRVRKARMSKKSRHRRRDSGYGRSHNGYGVKPKIRQK